MKLRIEAIANERLISVADVIREAIHLEIVLYKIKDLNGTVFVNMPGQNPITIVNKYFVVNLSPADLIEAELKSKSMSVEAKGNSQERDSHQSSDKSETRNMVESLPLPQATLPNK